MSDKKDKQVEIVFDIKKLAISEDDNRVYGIDVKAGKKGKLVGKIGESIKKALLDAGKCDK